MPSPDANLKNDAVAYLVDLIAKRHPTYLPSERELTSLLGVSRLTVRNALAELTKMGFTRAIHGKGHLVLPQTGRELSKGRIGLIAPKGYRQDEGELFTALESYIRGIGMKLYFVSMDVSDDLFTARLAEFLNEVDIAVFTGGIIDSERIYSIIKPKLDRCVVLANVCNENYPVKYVHIDLEEGCFKLANHLLSKGHRKIAFLGHLKDEMRMKGLKAAFEKYGLPCDESNLFETNGGSRHNGFEGIKKVFASGQKFTALLCHNDLVALGAMEYCFMKGIRIPQDLCLTGFDNLSDSALYPVPLTTAEPDKELMARTILEIAGRPTKGKQGLAHLVSVKMFIRESTNRELATK